MHQSFCSGTCRFNSHHGIRGSPIHNRQPNPQSRWMIKKTIRVRRPPGERDCVSRRMEGTSGGECASDVRRRKRLGRGHFSQSALYYTRRRMSLFVSWAYRYTHEDRKIGHTFELPLLAEHGDGDRRWWLQAAGLRPWNLKDARGVEGDQCIGRASSHRFGGVYVGSRWACWSSLTAMGICGKKRGRS